MTDTSEMTGGRRVVHVELRHLLLGIGALVLTVVVLAVAGLIGYLIGVRHDQHDWRCAQVALPAMGCAVIQPGGPIQPMPSPMPRAGAVGPSSNHS